VIERPAWIPRPLSSYHPLLYHLALGFRRVERRLAWLTDGHRYAHRRLPDNLALRVKKHQSVLIRKLGDADIELQHNKVDNLRIVIDELDGLIIGPGETFSFCKSVGKPTRSRGFKKGMELVRGKPRAGVGGGICQASNLIFWLALHSPLVVVERHHHSFDPFPDQGRVLPFASGATVMYNHRDLRLYNPTDQSFQLRLWFDKKCLNGEFRCERYLPYSYSIFERQHRFEKRGEQWRRCNQLWRRVIDKGNGGRTLRNDFLFANDAWVRYQPSLRDLAKTSSLD